MNWIMYGIYNILNNTEHIFFGAILLYLPKFFVCYEVVYEQYDDQSIGDTPKATLYAWLHHDLECLLHYRTFVKGIFNIIKEQ